LGYLALKHIHVTSVALSLVLFLLRGGLMMAGSEKLRLPLLRILPHLVDTVLLASAIGLAVTLRQYPFVAPWVTVKVILLVVYIVLGSLALKRGRTRAQRSVYFVLAVATFLFIVSVARAHHPLGFLAPVLA